MCPHNSLYKTTTSVGKGTSMLTQIQTLPQLGWDPCSIPAFCYILSWLTMSPLYDFALPDPTSLSGRPTILLLAPDDQFPITRSGLFNVVYTPLSADWLLLVATYRRCRGAACVCGSLPLRNIQWGPLVASGRHNTGPVDWPRTLSNTSQVTTQLWGPHVKKKKIIYSHFHIHT